MSKVIVRLAALALLLGTLAVARPATAASVVVVDDDGFASAFNCDATTPAFATIQAGVNAVDAGGIVKVCPGIYNENVVATKPVTLQGPQANVNAVSGGRIAGGPAEATIQGNSVNGTVLFLAGNSTINGFTVQNNANGFGINLPGGQSGNKAIYNIVTNNVSGIYAGGDGTNVSYNRIINNNQTGPGNGDGIYGDGGLTNANLTNNGIYNQQNAAILLVGQPYVPGIVQQVNLTNNSMSNAGPTGHGSFIVIYGASQLNIMNNGMSNGSVDPAGSSAIYLDNVIDPNVSGNTVVNADFSGIVITAGTLGPAVFPSGVRLQSNRVFNGTGNGIDVRFAASGGVLVQSNQVQNFATNGILFAAGTSNNIIQSNTAASNGTDCRDNSVGAKTAGTANTWQANKGNTSVPAGLCFP
jgi:parallel beta-helix repeat protein